MKSFKVSRTYTNKGIRRDIIPLRYNFVFDDEAVRNSIEARCQVIRGELSYNTSLGVVLGDSQKHMDLVISEIILNTAGVQSIKSFTSSLDKVSRKYSATIIVNTTYNTQVEVTI